MNFPKLVFFFFKILEKFIKEMENFFFGYLTLSFCVVVPVTTIGNEGVQHETFTATEERRIS